MNNDPDFKAAMDAVAGLSKQYKNSLQSLAQDEAARPNSREGCRDRAIESVKMKDRKNVKDKIQPLLISYEAFVAYSKVSDNGLEVHGDRDSWKFSTDGIWVYSNALARHLLEIIRGNPIDKDSGLPHAYHLLWNAVAVLWHYNHKAEIPYNKRWDEVPYP